ncbi:M6 family metalloprotease domain containing protein [Nitzschia inconspicua]|uniref:M6 family metalloprotease domain containing protein n=1 Tax=Nitzschia inconspicua TaxID=303405 RepID=A0A9K3M516_9STRA|nr:M6 family metalloprotease domain containing protein [Nitzschia inconspicua]
MSSSSGLFFKGPSTRSAGFVVTALLLPAFALGMTSNPFPFQEVQPDGEVIDLQLHGDSYDAWMSDMDGYTVLRDPETGLFVYAEEDDQGGLKASLEAVVHTMSKNFQKGKGELNKNIAKKGKKLRPKKKDCENKLCGDMEGNQRRLSSLRGAFKGTERDDEYLPYPNFSNFTFQKGTGSHRQLNAAYSGNLRNLVVLIRWSDHVGRTLPSRQDISILMNHKGPHALCPSGSVRDVFSENSYGKLNLESVVADWVTVDNTEKFYANGAHGVTRVIWDAVRNALQQLDDKGMVDFAYFDQNMDKKIDAITILHSGYAAEFGGTDAYGQFYENRIWSHQWGLNNGPFVSKSGVTVREYHISPALWGLSGAGIGRIGVIAHETGHYLGLPDLYDTNGGGRGIGQYGLMANSWGWDGSQYWPPHLSGWSKFVLGWISATVPDEGINQVETTQNQHPNHPQLYIIQEGFPDGEFLLVENRQRKGYDKNMAQGGILIWHIDNGRNPNDFRNSLTREGFPGQLGWPENGNHYGVALVQADGLYQMERGVNMGDHGDVFHAMGVNELLPCLDLSACQYPNTDSYRGGIIARTNVSITDISKSGDIMTFRYHRGEDVTDSPTSAPSDAPTLGSPCNDNEELFELQFKTDHFSEDNSWSLINSVTGELIAAKDKFQRDTLYEEEFCLAIGYEYTFQLLDSWGDSICCMYGKGYYSVILEGVELFSGGEHIKYGVTHTFITGTASPTTEPSTSPTVAPTKFPSEIPSSAPSGAPTLCTCIR